MENPCVLLLSLISQKITVMSPDFQSEVKKRPAFEVKQVCPFKSHSKCTKDLARKYDLEKAMQILFAILSKKGDCMFQLSPLNQKFNS